MKKSEEREAAERIAGAAFWGEQDYVPSIPNGTFCTTYTNFVEAAVLVLEDIKRERSAL